MSFGKDTEIKAELKTGGRACQCAVCEAYFSGEAAFTRHLTSRGTDHVTCKSPDRMREIGMQQNRHGVWLTGLSEKKLKESEGEEDAA